MLLGVSKNKEKHPLPFAALRGCASVPFKWEEVPGKPKKTFMNDLIVSSHTSVSVAAVPFKWEEKPGKAKPFISKQNPSPSVTTLSQKSPNSTFVDGSRETSPKILLKRLESIPQVKLSRPKKLPIANISLPIQGTYSGQEDQDRGAEELVALNTWGGLEGEKELFEEVHCMKAEGITKSYTSQGFERRSSSVGWRTRASYAAPAQIENRVQTMMEKYKVVPVENFCKQKMTRPSLVFVDSSKKRDSWVTMVENIKKHHGNGCQEGLTFHFMQPAISPTEISSRNVHLSPKSITWGGMKVINAEEDRKGPVATDVPSLDLGTKQHQLKRNDSSPPPGSFNFVLFEERKYQQFIQGAGSAMDVVSIGTNLQSGKKPKCNQAFLKYSKHASKEPNHFQEKPELDARLKETNPHVFVGKYGGHSKRTRFPTK